MKSPCSSCPFRKDIRYMTPDTAARNLRWMSMGLKHDCHKNYPEQRDWCAGYLLSARHWNYDSLPITDDLDDLGVHDRGIPLYDSPHDMLTNGVVHTLEDWILPPDLRMTDDEKRTYMNHFVGVRVGIHPDELQGPTTGTP